MCIFFFYLFEYVGNIIHKDVCVWIIREHLVKDIKKEKDKIWAKSL